MSERRTFYDKQRVNTFCGSPNSLKLNGRGRPGRGNLILGW